MTVQEKAVEWMLDLARDDSHGYDQDDRWGEYGDYDCSSAVITAYQKAGVPVRDNGATYTGNMREIFLRSGFRDVTGEVNMQTGAGLRPGDVLLNYVHHTAMYVGDGLEAEASINEYGGAHGGQPGDQTGREILVRAYRNYPWDCVLRYYGNDSPEEEEEHKGTTAAYTLQLGEVMYDDCELSVAVLQAMLNALGYTDAQGLELQVDGDFGPRTEYVVCNYQREHGLADDGIVGPKTWSELFKSLF